jgi:hypothetical protein
MRACSESWRLLASMVLAVAIHASAVAGVHQSGTSDAIVGTWWQSAWKLCNPATQLGPSDLDPPIDELVFNADRTFSVTWRGGGAHTGDIPHVFIPDYRGRYTVEPRAGRIQMQIDNGLFVPHDFAGSGAYAITGNTLTLTGVWFGTKQARQKPDICELTFTRR